MLGMQRLIAVGIVYRPLCDINELVTIRNLCLSSVSSGQFLILHEKWGGSIRLTLAHEAAILQEVAVP